MRELGIGTKKHTTVLAMDEPGFGCSHVYEIRETNPPTVAQRTFATVKFQKGPIKEHGRNGIHNEDLIAIVIDRLEGFQKTDFACDENKQALEYLYRAMEELNSRTEARRKRGVEGTSQV